MIDNPKFLDLDSHLHKVRNRVYRVGVELEGAWITVPAGSTIINDGSVHVSQSEHPQAKQVIYNNSYVARCIGELPSPAMELTNIKGEYTELFTAWMKGHYPEIINATMGMHVHQSFRSALQYQILMDSESYMWTMVEYLTRWGQEQVRKKLLPANHCLFQRLAGNSEYCQLKWNPDDQIVKQRKEFDHHGHGHRYTVVHFCGRFGTVEVRVPPMMPTAEMAIGMVREVCAITSAFLVKTAKREEPLLTSWIVDRAPIVEQEVFIV